MFDMDNSHENNRRPVASFNPDPRWPSGYFQALEELGVKKAHRPFYAHWVRQFFQLFLKQRRRDLGRTEITAFLNQLRRDPSVAHWQVTLKVGFALED